MDKKTATVLRGYLQLDSEEQDEFIKELNNYIRGNFSVRKSVQDSIDQIYLGPLGNTCPCCGR
jgi:hypothetical protein